MKTKSFSGSVMPSKVLWTDWDNVCGIDLRLELSRGENKYSQEMNIRKLIVGVCSWNQDKQSEAQGYQSADDGNDVPANS